MKTLILDNYDSFTYNLYQAIAALKGNPFVYKNDQISLAAIKKLKPTHIIISPGPGTPLKKADFGVCHDVIRSLKVPILGVCLGHQGIMAAFGGKITYAPKIMHGKTSLIELDNTCPLFKGLPKEIQAMRYHSLVGEHSSLKIIAKTPDGLTMAVMHPSKPIFGIQFHPESFKTEQGSKILQNFLKIKQ